MEETISKYQRRAMIIGLAALAVSLIFAIFNFQQFFHSYLLAFVFFLGIALGSLAILLLHQLTGGMWGAVVRRLLESATRTLPLLAILFVPLLLGAGQLYLWMDREKMRMDELLRHKQPYLNFPFFVGRAVLYFAVWIGLSLVFNRLSRKQDEDADVPLMRRMQRMGGYGLLLYGLTVTFAAVDWLMSLDPHWFSTIYGLLVIVGQVLSGFAFAITMAILLSRFEPLSTVIDSMHLRDLGNLLLAFVMIWAYLSFSQLLIIWSGNIPEEIPWYVHRLHSSWQFLGLALIVFHFAVPFLVLLSRRNKRNTGILLTVAVGLLAMRLLDLFWFIEPEFHHEGFAIHPADILLPIGLGGIWFAYYLRELKSRPLLAFNDPNIAGVAIP